MNPDIGQGILITQLNLSLQFIHDITCQITVKSQKNFSLWIVFRPVVKTWCYGVSASPPPAPRTTSPAPPTSRTSPPPTGEKTVYFYFFCGTSHGCSFYCLPSDFGWKKKKKCNRFSHQRCKFMKFDFNSFLHSSFSSHKLKLIVKNLLYISEKRKNSYKFQTLVARLSPELLISFYVQWRFFCW